MADNTERFKCISCGCELNQFTGYPTPYKWKTASGYSPVCVKCQQSYYDALCEKVKPLLAHFYCCIAFNVPYIREEVPRYSREPVPWKSYLERIRVKQLNVRESQTKDDEGKTVYRQRYTNFFDGETDIFELLGGKHRPVEVLQNETERRDLPVKERKPTARQLLKWGENYIFEQYKELDRIYENFGAAYKGNPDPRVEINLVKVAKLQMEQDEALRKKDIDTVKRLQDTIKSILETEGMKATDAKPVENLRIDAIADYLEKSGAMKDRKIVKKSQLIGILQKGRHRYRNSLDVVDEMLFAIVNAVRKNDGMSELYEIPLDLQVADEKGELQGRVTHAEREVLEELGMPLSPKEKATTDDKKGDY